MDVPFEENAWVEDSLVNVLRGALSVVGQVRQALFSPLRRTDTYPTVRLTGTNDSLFPARIRLGLRQWPYDRAQPQSGRRSSRRDPGLLYRSSDRGAAKVMIFTSRVFGMKRHRMNGCN